MEPPLTKCPRPNQRNCPHCSEIVSYKSYRVHKRLYCNDDGIWFSVEAPNNAPCFRSCSLMNHHQIFCMISSTNEIRKLLHTVIHLYTLLKMMTSTRLLIAMVYIYRVNMIGLRILLSSLIPFSLSLTRAVRYGVTMMS